VQFGLTHYGYAGVIRQAEAVHNGALDAMAIFNVMSPLRKGDTLIAQTDDLLIWEDSSWDGRGHNGVMFGPAKLECVSGGNADSLSECVVQKM